MNPLVARGLRRGAVGAAALTATLVAHAASGADVALTATAPLVWMGVVLFGAQGLWRRCGEGFRAWGPVRMLATLALVQAALHVAIHVAPWAFGFVGHAHAPLLSATAVGAHAAVALVFGAALWWGETVLSRMVDVVDAVRSALRARRGWHRGTVLVPRVAAALSRVPAGCAVARGPPWPAAVHAGPATGALRCVASDAHFPRP